MPGNCASARRFRFPDRPDGSECGISSGGQATADAGAADGAVYVVKTGDTLGKIARLHGTSYKKLMALNDLKTTSIRPGQKLKLPAPKPAGVDVVPASASNTPPPQRGRDTHDHNGGLSFRPVREQRTNAQTSHGPQATPRPEVQAQSMPP